MCCNNVRGLMRILIISTHFPPQRGIAPLRPYSFAKYWASQGHDVTVLTTEKYDFESDLDLDCSAFTVIEVPLPRWHRRFTLKARASIKNDVKPGGGRVRGVEYLFRSLKEVREKTGILRDQRMPSHLDVWVFSALRVIKGKKWDVVVSSYSPYVAHLIGYSIRRAGGAGVWVADYRDLWTQNHLYVGVWPFTFLENHLERLVNNAADIITTVSYPLAQELREKYPHRRIEVIENGFDSDDLVGLPLEKFFSDEKTVVAYTGSIYPQLQDPSPLFRAIRELSLEGCKGLDRLEIVFAGTSSDYVMGLAVKMNVSQWVRHIGMVSRKDALRIQRDACALLFLGADKDGKAGILTGKIFEYLNSSTEVWGVGVENTDDVGRLITESGAGLVFGVNYLRIKLALLDLLSGNQKVVVHARKDVLDRYSRRGLAGKLMGSILDVADGLNR